MRGNFDVINWTLAEIEKMNTKIRKLITCNRMHHPRTNIERLYVKRENGGRGSIQELTYKTTTIGLKEHLDNTTYWMLLFVKTHEKQNNEYSIRKESKQVTNQFDFTPKEIDIKDKTPQTAKNKNKTEQKYKRTKSIKKRPVTKIPIWTIRTKN